MLGARLTPVEPNRAAVRGRLSALEPHPRERVFEAAHWGEVTGAGVPLPPFLNVMDDARWWADLANRSERKASRPCGLRGAGTRRSGRVPARHVQHGRKEPRGMTDDPRRLPPNVTPFGAAQRKRAPPVRRDCAA